MGWGISALGVCCNEDGRGPKCGNVCCASDETCVDGVCCSPHRVCGETCCPLSTMCCGSWGCLGREGNGVVTRYGGMCCTQGDLCCGDGLCWHDTCP